MQLAKRPLRATVIFVIAVLQFSVAELPNTLEREKDVNYWNALAQNDLTEGLRMKPNKNIAKNVILFVGDGMGVSTVTAARILKGQMNGQPGEETILRFEEFSNVALSKTYSLTTQTPDSASTANAFLSGAKTATAVVGLGPNAEYNDCIGQKNKESTSMLDWAMAAGKRTGIVTTARITHATVAAAYAHSANRDWEGDVSMEGVEGGCKDVARQLIEDNPDINVIFGGGRRHFLPNTTNDPELNSVSPGQRQDGRNLIKEWKDNMRRLGRKHKYAWNKEGFSNINPKQHDYALGLFESSHMNFELDRPKKGTMAEPSIAEMTRKAIRILKKEKKGFFLLVEGARIDHGHHYGLVKKALTDTLALEQAIGSAVDMTNPEDTLVVVTADHSHVFGIAGYSYRGNDILGLQNPSRPAATDDLQFSTLGYINGPGFSSPRRNMTNDDLSNKEYVFPSGVPLNLETHAGEDVGIYAQGPMSHLMYGVREQNYIAHMMAFSACVGPYKNKCKRD